MGIIKNSLCLGDTVIKKALLPKQKDDCAVVPPSFHRKAVLSAQYRARPSFLTAGSGKPLRREFPPPLFLPCTHRQFSEKRGATVLVFILVFPLIYKSAEKNYFKSTIFFV